MNRIIITTYILNKINKINYWLLKAHWAFILFIGISMSSFAQSNKIDPNGYNVFYYEDGTKSSEGTFRDGKPDGFWKTYYENGVLKSEGNRKDFLLDSLWKFYRNDGILLQEVMYARDKKNGLTSNFNEEGLLISKIPYENDTIQGVAEYYYPEAQRIERQEPYSNNKLEGTGYEFALDGRITAIVTYEKGFVSDRQVINQKNAQGQKTGLWMEFFEDEEEPIVRMEGRYSNGLKHGYFREYDKKGLLLNTVKYVNGQVMENVEELMAVDIERTFYPDAQVHWEKTFLGSQPHGIWKEYNDTGAVINSQIYKNGILLGEGIIDEEGVKQGPWKEYYADGQLRAEGEYLDGARYKQWKFYHPNGELEQIGSYNKSGLAQGEWKWFYDTKKLRRVETFRKGKEEGEVVEYDTSGKEILVGYYIDGLEDGDWMLESGEYKEEGKFIEGLRQGEWITYYLSNGKVRFEGEYSEGQPHGKHTFYYDNGTKMLEGKYQMGFKQGTWKRFDRDGLLLLTIDYKEGVVYRLDGKKVKSKDQKSEDDE